MSYYPQDIIDKVNKSVDLVALISPYVNLKRTGGSYSALCPFHAEKTPSFVVTPHKHMFYCFGCHQGGGPINFLMKIKDLSFPEALEELARQQGIDLPEPERGGGLRIVQPQVNKAALYEVLKEAAKFYHHQLWVPEGKEARLYLAGRGLTQTMCREFLLGYAPGRWDGLWQHLRAQGFSAELAQSAGLVKESKNGGQFYDLFRDRLMVPIFDQPNQVVAFGGRRLNDDPQNPKYINSPETPIFKKNRTLYGLSRARPFIQAAEMVFLVEGYFDLISMVAAGINEVVAPLGTALTENQVGILRRLAREVMLVFDGDAAGAKASARTWPMFLNAEVEARILTLPQGHDPDSFIREFGAEALYELASNSVEMLDFQVARLKASHPDTLTGQTRLLSELRSLLAQVPDVAQARLVRRRLAQLVNLDEELLGNFKKSVSFTGELQRIEPEEKPFDQIAGQLLSHLLIYPEVAESVLSEMGAWWPSDDSRFVFEILKQEWEKSGEVLPASALAIEHGGLTALISQAAFSEREFSPQEAQITAQELMEHLKRKWRKIRQLELSEAIGKAQAEGNLTEALRLMQEKKDLT